MITTRVRTAAAGVISAIGSLLCTVPLHAQWVQQNSGTSSTLTDVVMLDAVSAIAVGRNGSILRTTTSGATWTDVAAPLSFIQPWNGVAFLDAHNGIVVGEHGSVLTTADGGAHWIPHQIPGGRTCLCAMFDGPFRIYVGTDSGWVYTTTDTGRTWSSEKISQGQIRSLFPYRGPSLSGPSAFAVTPYSICTKSVFAGPSWTEMIIPNFLALGSEACDGEYANGGGPGFIVGVQGDLRAQPAVMRRALSDTAWRFATTGISGSGTLRGVSAPSASVIYVCGTNGMLYRSANGGDTWIDQTRQTNKRINAVNFFDEQRGFAVGDSGVIYSTLNGGLDAVDEREDGSPAHFEIRQNYPNPFNSTTVFSFTIPSEEFVSLTVVDIRGTVAACLVSETLSAGTHVRRWDAAGLSSGVYFYCLRAGEYRGIRKLVYLK